VKLRVHQMLAHVQISWHALEVADTGGTQRVGSVTLWDVLVADAGWLY